jgi:transposase, IS30 family
MKCAIRALHSRLPEKVFKMAMTDRGKEFSCYSVLKKDLEIAFYFADPYSSWQRGSNENTNGLLREFSSKRQRVALKWTNDQLKKMRYFNDIDSRFY